MPRLLFLVSGARELPLADGSMHETGYFAEEALTPYERFVEAGVDIDVATPDGRAPHADPYGLEPIFHYPDEDEDFLASITRTFAHDVDDIRLTLRHLTEIGLIAARRVHLALVEAGVTPEQARDQVARAARTAWDTDRNFLDVLDETGDGAPLDRAALDRAYTAVVEDSRRESERVAATLAANPGFQQPTSLAALSDEQLAGYDAVFAPGGHGPMVDLADNPDVTRLLRILHQKRAPIASLCHGPALLLAAPANLDGQWIFDGYRVTAFTDEEEYQTPPGKLGMPWLLEASLRNAGAVFDDARAAWTSHVVVDRNVITAQNPNSADAVADAVLKALDVL
ncbi:DJ-1/PfpI family protein [Pseudonocardia endophytica]|uniref:Adenylosuccinate lyase-like protein n=1 Tax=Pseudonocardia endophytica TaxID=401976 RepID=A0A4R1HXW0_PSEEN|nr:DJ-1/PfpI family protein [Pseudonocardia endophytica]TCK27617.1 adenylosuccinate lyase-like protein [Pseudonocardia endophytica]